MPESATDTVLLGKGKRVLGTFLLLLGAGIILESSLRWLGGAVMLGGAAAFVRGALEARTPAAHATPVAIDAHSESRL